MMGRRQRIEAKLFYTQVDLDSRVRADHPLRQIQQTIDFQFVRAHVQPLYGRRGNPSVDPIVLMKLMLLLVLENVRSERQLMSRMPERLDWMWFCGYDWDSVIPDHSVISKARRRWGVTVFTDLFQRILDQCVQAGLVDGRTLHVDASVIKADADKATLHPALRLAARTLYERLDQPADGEPPASPGGGAASADNAAASAMGADAPVTGVSVSAAQDHPMDARVSPGADTNAQAHADDAAAADATTADAATAAAAAADAAAVDDDSAPPGAWISSTDPDARLTRKNGQTYLGYKDHRAIDDQCGIITATVTTDAATAESHVLEAALDQHRQNIGSDPHTVVTDKAYGTAKVYESMARRQITPCIPHQHYRGRHGVGIYEAKDFVYDRQRDAYLCPQGQWLHRYTTQPGRQRYRAAAGVCAACPLRQACTRARDGRRLTRHVGQDWIDWADGCYSREHRRRLRRRRMHRAEGSFAQAANNHGYKRARWRGLMGMTIQNLLIAAVQNLGKLIRARHRGPAIAAQAVQANPSTRPLAGLGAFVALARRLTTHLSRISSKTFRELQPT